MSKTSIGIYISSKFVDIIEIGGSKASPIILGFKRQEIPPKASIPETNVESNIKQHQDSVAVAIKEALDGLKLKSQSAHTVLSLNDVMIRYFDMPVLPKSEQFQAIRYESKKYVPFKVDKIISDFKILISSKNKKTMDVFFIAATKDRLQSHISRFDETGMQVAGIDIIPFALLRVLILEQKADLKGAVAIVYTDNDRENLSIHIMESGMPFISRDVRIYADDKDAFFEKVASEIRVSIDYYRRQKPEHDLAKVILCGEEIFPGLDTYISGEIKIITDTIYKFTKVKNIDKTPSSAIIAIGTAFGGLVKSRYSIDLSPMAKATKKRYAFDMMLLEAVASIAFIVLSYTVSNLAVKESAQKLAQLHEKSNSLPYETSLFDLDQLLEKKQEKIESFKLIQFIQQDRALLANKLSAIARHVTSQHTPLRAVWLKSLSYKESFIIGDSKYPSEIARELSISGSTFAPEIGSETGYINKFFESLQADMDFMNLFHQIELGAIERKAIEDYWVSDFTVSAYSHKMADTAKRRSRR
jgi:Tfp pilus assembly PilM family ATPase